MQRSTKAVVCKIAKCSVFLGVVAAAIVILAGPIRGAFEDWLVNRLPDSATRGQYGDQFGALNALFSGLAFAGLIYAVLMQREELALQREELQLTRKEMRRQRRELNRSASAQQALEKAAKEQAEASTRLARVTAIRELLANLAKDNDFAARVFKKLHPARDPQEVVREKVEMLKTALLEDVAPLTLGIVPPPPPPESTRPPVEFWN
jgi:hypothetical protein